MSELTCGADKERSKPTGELVLAWPRGERGKSAHLENNVSVIIVELQRPDRVGRRCGHGRKLREGSRVGCQPL